MTIAVDLGRKATKTEKRNGWAGIHGEFFPCLLELLSSTNILDPECRASLSVSKLFDTMMILL